MGDERQRQAMSALRPGTVKPTVTVYWRPGCPFCARLRFGLRRARINTREVNVWDDPDAVAAVRAITGGDEAVPTVVVGTVALVNPSTRQIVTALNDRGVAAPPAGGTRAARWTTVGVVIAASFVVDAFVYHDASWALDGLAVAVYAAFTRWR